MIDVEAIFNKYLGQAVEAEDPSNKDQCFDWAFKYCDELGIDRAAIRHLNAYQIFTQPNDLTLQYFDYIPNTPNGVPQLGDILVFGTGVGTAGHVAVVEHGDTHQVTSTDQNWNGHHYVERINHPYDNVLGWLRPKTLHPAPVVSPEVQEPTITDQTKINLGSQLGELEVQAIRSELLDSRNQLGDKDVAIHNLQDQVKDLTEKLTQPTPQPTFLSDFSTNDLLKELVKRIFSK